MKRALISLLIFGSVLQSYAREQLVRGVVTTGNGDPVIGLMVLEVGTTNGTVTDMDGRSEEHT